MGKHVMGRPHQSGGVARERDLIDAARREAEENQRLGAAGVTLDAGPALPPPDSFPGYEITREIHRGGQGVVYQALQKATRRKVAIKVLREGPFAGDRDRARFEREVRTLARLNHPGIVAIHDSGSAAGQDFFVMDYVPGQPLDVHMASEERTVRETFALFARVCHAVNAAHLKGVIHRDLKPSNILVDPAGEPRILDFGLARTGLRAESGVTRTGQFVGSLPWASPEQAEGDPERIDVRTDVYSLGVILYHMLTRRFPYPVSGPLRAVLDHIASAEPARPRTFRRDVDDEAEAIALKCLRKDPDLRYQTAGELARDAERYVKGEPIEARSDSAWYVLSKALRHYRRHAAVAGALVILGVFGIVSLALWRRAETARANEGAQRAAAAEQGRKELEQVAAFQAGMLGGIDAQRMGSRLREDLLAEVRGAHGRAGVDPARIDTEVVELERLLAGANFTNLGVRSLDRNVLQRALEAIDKEFGAQPLVQARLFQTAADTLGGLGLNERGAPAQQRALEIRRRILGDDHPDTLTSIRNTGRLLMRQSELAEAEPYVREALERSRRVLGDDHPDTLTSINSMGALREGQGNLADAEPYYRECLGRRRRVLGDDHPDTLTSVNNVGVLLLNQGKADEAEPYLREAVEKSRVILGDDHPGTLTSISNLGGALRELGRPAEAEPYVREALEGSRRVLGDDHPDTLLWINNLGEVLRSQGKLAEAEPCLLETVEKSRRILGEDDPYTLVAINNLARLLQAQGKLDEAERYFRESLERHRRVLGDDHLNTLTSIGNLGVLLREQGKAGEAEPLHREALEGNRRRLGDDHPSTLMSLHHMGGVLREQGKAAEAEPLHREALAGFERRFGGDDWRVGNARLGLGRALTALQRFTEAGPELTEAERILRAAPSVPPGRHKQCIEALVALYEAWDKAEPAGSHDSQAAQWRGTLK